MMLFRVRDIFNPNNNQGLRLFGFDSRVWRQNQAKPNLLCVHRVHCALLIGTILGKKLFTNGVYKCIYNCIQTNLYSAVGDIAEALVGPNDQLHRYGPARLATQTKYKL